MPQDWNYGTDRLGNASVGTGTEWRDSERYRLITEVTAPTFRVTQEKPPESRAAFLCSPFATASLARSPVRILR